MMRKRCGSKPNEEKGSVLILVLWTLSFLAVLALAVGAHVSAHVTLAGRLMAGTKAYYLARAGVERASLETACDSNEWDGLTESWSNDEEIFKDISLADGSFCVSYTCSSLSGQVVTNYGVIDEERKININSSSQALLKSLVEIAGEVDPMTASEISSSIIDWRDENDELLIGGAEDSYYAALNRPYPCHNGEFQSLHELLLVKGVGCDLFSKLKRYLTIYGTGKVNINTAQPMVLRCLADSCGKGDRATAESLIIKIVQFREAGNAFMEAGAPAIIGQLNDFVELLPGEKSLLSGMMGAVTIRSACFRGVAEGKVTGRQTADSRITFVFDRDLGVKLYWYE